MMMEGLLLVCLLALTLLDGIRLQAPLTTMRPSAPALLPPCGMLQALPASHHFVAASPRFRPRRGTMATPWTMILEL